MGYFMHQKIQIFVKYVSFIIIFSTGHCIAQPFSLVGDSAKNKSIETDKNGMHKIAESLKKAKPDIEVESIRQSPVEGLSIVKIKNGPSLFTNKSGTLVFTGDLLELKDGTYSRWEDPIITANRKIMYDKINPKDAIIFPAKGSPKAIVYVFTDVDCGFCRKMHSQISSYSENGIVYQGYSDLGIEIRYLAFPRTGVETSSGKKTVSAWCSKDKQAALTKLKTDQSIPEITCNNPVARQFDMGTKIGVNGTPALWLPGGSLRPGYVSPSELAAILKIK
jgi:thiol:disulfide interchange protein DsbC